MLRKLAASIVLTSALVAMPTAAVYLNYRTFNDDACSNWYGEAEVTVHAANTGTCTAFTLSSNATGTVADVLGYTGAAYAKAWCPSDSANEAALFIYSSASCSDASLIAVRRHAATQSMTCAGRAQMFCSAFDPDAPAVPAIPDGFSTEKICKNDCSTNCATIATRANACVPTISRSAPTARSQRTLCGNGVALTFSYDGDSCAGTPTRATQQPTGVCRVDRTVTCPVNPSSPLPATIPTIPTVAEGWLIKKSQCDGVSCSSGCRIDAQPLDRCTPVLGTEGRVVSKKSKCTGGNNVINMMYNTQDCSAAPSTGTLFPVDTDASCTSARGKIECSNEGELGNIPQTFGGAFTFYEGSATCGGSYDSRVVLPVNACGSDASVGYKLLCPTTGSSSMEVYEPGCTGAAAQTIAAAEGVCTVVRGGSAVVNCNVVIGRNGTTFVDPAEKTGAAYAGSRAGLWSVLSMVAAGAIALAL